MLLECVERQGITVLETVPSMLSVIVEQPRQEGVRDTLRWLICNAEALPPALCRRWLELYPEVALLNAYGPTEG